MLEKCAVCNARILAGGQKLARWTFCGDECVTRFRTALVDDMIPKEIIEAQIREVFVAPCSSCGTPTRNDLYAATKVSAFLVAYTIQTNRNLCCASCGRKHRLRAALHCLVAGWWSPKAAFCNLFILPTNLVAAAFIRSPREPSDRLITLVKSSLSEPLVAQLEAAAAKPPVANFDLE